MFRFFVSARPALVRTPIPGAAAHIRRVPIVSGTVDSRHNWTNDSSLMASSSPLRTMVRAYASGGSHRQSSNDWGGIGSATIPTLGVAAVLSFIFSVRWYMNRDPTYEELQGEARKHLDKACVVETSAEATDSQSVKRSGLIGGTKVAASLSSTLPLEQEAIVSQVNSSETDDAHAQPLSAAPSTTEPETVSSNPLSDAAATDQTGLVYVNANKTGFPNHVRYVIVGAGTAGLAAARAIRASDPRSKVLMIAGGCNVSGSAGAEPGIAETEFTEPPPYLRPPLSKELWRRSREREARILQPGGDIRRHSWLYYEAECFFLQPEELDTVEYGGVALLRGDPVASLDPDAHTIRLASGREIGYDRCLLATGGSPKRLDCVEKCAKTQTDLFQSGLVSYFRTLADYRRLRELADTYRSIGGRIAVLGGGFLGSELAVSLRTEPNQAKPDSSSEKTQSDAPSTSNSGQQLSVMHLFRESAPMGHVLPPCLANVTGRYEAARGVELWPSSVVVGVSLITPDTQSDNESMNLPSTGLTLRTEAETEKRRLPALQAVAAETESRRIRLRVRHSGPNGEKVEEVEVDHLVCAIGIQPNTGLAESGFLEVDSENGGFLVNAELEARAGVYAAGDAASFWDPVLSSRRRVEHLNFAEKTGQLAGRNMVASFPDPDRPVDPSSHTESSRYRFQSSLWSNLGPDISWDAVGRVDSRRLVTRAYFVPSTEQETGSTQTSIPNAELGRLGQGVVFYLTPKERKLVGMLLWNLPDEIYEDKDSVAPSRLNLARSLLIERRLIGREADESEEQELQRLASYFDLTGEVERDYAEIKAYIEAKKKEERELASSANPTPSPPSTLQADVAPTVESTG